MRTDKPAPMTNAERQRKHRDKRRTELQALRAVVPQSALERDLQAQVMSLQWKLQTTARDLAAAQASSTRLEAAHSSAQAWSEALRTLLPKLSPASVHVVRQHLQACGLELADSAGPGTVLASMATTSTPQLIF